MIEKATCDGRKYPVPVQPRLGFPAIGVSELQYLGSALSFLLLLQIPSQFPLIYDRFALPNYSQLIQ
jgi:hypothetical protein